MYSTGSANKLESDLGRGEGKIFIGGGFGDRFSRNSLETSKNLSTSYFLAF